MDDATPDELEIAADLLEENGMSAAAGVLREKAKQGRISYRFADAEAAAFLGSGPVSQRAWRALMRADFVINPPSPDRFERLG